MFSSLSQLVLRSNDDHSQLAVYQILVYWRGCFALNLVQVVPLKIGNVIGNLILTYEFYFSNLSHADHFK